MKRIINGKRYDTETAKVLATASSYVGKSDFEWWEETLYRTPRGNYFIAGFGNARSRWATIHEGGDRGGGQGILPINVAKCMEWLELNECVDVLENEFQNQIQDA